jgi:steroid delta-isomerase-like uncharacterized protein
MSQRDWNAAIARRYFEELLAGDVDLANEIVAEDVAFHGPNYWGEVIQGREGFKGFIRYLRTAFPDMVFTVQDEAADETRVMTAFQMTGTHEGQWLDLAPTGKRIDLAGADIFRIEGGQIKEIRVFYDTLGLMQQLGVVPLPGAMVA